MHSIEYLREWFSYDPDTGRMEWRKKVGKGRNFPGDTAGRLRPDGYLGTALERKGYMIHRLAWALMHGEWPKHDIDHINGNRADNRLANLRDVPRKINLQNRRRSDRDSKTGVLGVSPNGSGFIARIKADGVKRNLGTFKTVEEAHEMYMRAKRQLHQGNTL